MERSRYIVCRRRATTPHTHALTRTTHVHAGVSMVKLHLTTESEPVKHNNTTASIRQGRRQTKREQRQSQSERFSYLVLLRYLSFYLQR